MKRVARRVLKGLNKLDFNIRDILNSTNGEAILAELMAEQDSSNGLRDATEVDTSNVHSENLYEKYHEPLLVVEDGNLVMEDPSPAEVSWRRILDNKNKTYEELEAERAARRDWEIQLKLQSDPVYRFNLWAADNIDEFRHLFPAMLMSTGVRTKSPLLYGLGSAWEGANAAYDWYHNDKNGMYRSVFEPVTFIVLDQIPIWLSGLSKENISKSISKVSRRFDEIRTRFNEIRTRFNEMKLKPVVPTEEEMIRRGWVLNKNYPHIGEHQYVLPSYSTEVIEPHPGSVVLRLLTDAPQFITKDGHLTTEIHLMPQATYVQPKSSPIHPNPPHGIIKSEKLNPSSIKALLKAMADLPKGTMISSSADATAPALSKLSWTFPEKLQYVVTGKVPFRIKAMPKKGVVGYSTDVYPVMLNIANKHPKEWVLRPSLTTEMTNTNSLGQNIDLSPFYTNKSRLVLVDYKNKYNLPNPELPTRDTFIEFSNFTPELVALWNRDFAPKVGIYIDPMTRRALLYVLTKIR